MGSLVSSAAALPLTSLLALLFGVSSIFCQDLRERDALCNGDGCFVVHFQRKTFLDSWRTCKEKGGNLVTIKRKEDAAAIASLFSHLELPYSRTKVRVWIGLQRQPRQCTTLRPLRGFSWTTGDQDTEYTNWQKEDSPSMCSAPRCVVMSYSTQEQNDNFKWLDGSCSVAVDGYLCHYAYKGMCAPLWNEGAGDILYTTPFGLSSTLLTHVPFGSMASVPCSSDTNKQSVLCTVKDDGSVGWSRDSPLCPDSFAHNWCDKDNGGCEHFCRLAGVHSYCECAEGYQLGENGQSCELLNFCQGAPCEYECLSLLDGYRCACRDGYMLASDDRSCLDVDECLQSPCEHLCVNIPGTFKCQCREGYNLNDEGECEDVDECMNDPCEHACENTLGSHICHCYLGFTPVPEETSKCQDTDECQIPGTCDHMCVNYEGAFQCYCEKGYELMADNYSCRKTGEGYDQSAITPPYPWVTHQPRDVWDPAEYEWNQQQSHTDWTLEAEQHLNWLTDPPRVLDSDVIWVTSANQDEVPFDSTLDPLTQTPKRKEENTNNREDDWLELGQRSQSELEVLTNSIYPSLSTSTESITTPDWYELDEEETTTAAPFFFTSTISGGAWNWWAELTTTSQGAVDPEDLVMDQNMPAESINNDRGKEQYPYQESSHIPQEEENDFYTHSQDSDVPTHLTPSQPSSEGGKSGDIGDSVQEDRGQEQSSPWLLVGLLVPICIFIVVMVALGIIFCPRCAVQPRNKNATDCYHWISGAHDKQGAPNPPAGVKTHV